MTISRVGSSLSIDSAGSIDSARAIQNNGEGLNESDLHPLVPENSQCSTDQVQLRTDIDIEQIKTSRINKLNTTTQKIQKVALAVLAIGAFLLAISPLGWGIIAATVIGGLLPAAYIVSLCLNKYKTKKEAAINYWNSTDDINNASRFFNKTPLNRANAKYAEVNELNQEIRELQQTKKTQNSAVRNANDALEEAERKLEEFVNENNTATSNVNFKKGFRNRGRVSIQSPTKLQSDYQKHLNAVAEAQKTFDEAQKALKATNAKITSKTKTLKRKKKAANEYLNSHDDILKKATSPYMQQHEGAEEQVV